MPSVIPYGNANKLVLVSVTLSPVSVAANTVAAQTVTVPGVQLNDFVTSVTKPTEQAGLAVASNRVSANNTVTMMFVNATAVPIVPTAAETYTFSILRRDGPSTGAMS